MVCFRLHFWVNLALLTILSSHAFTVGTPMMRPSVQLAASDDDSETVARRIIVKGDVQGGYYRACVINEASRYRRLVGTMTPPDESADQAEIYVEGKKKLVDSFVRWCKRGNVGLSQKITVDEVIEEDPTGLYDEFYASTKSQ